MDFEDQPNVLLSIVIPAFNEADRLPGSLTEIALFAESHPELGRIEILVVDDGSDDDTAGLASRFVAPEGILFRVVAHSNNRGKGAAVRSGFRASTGDFVLLCDADLSAPIEEVLSLMEAGNEDLIIIGSRAVDRQLILVRQPVLRDLMGRVFNLLVQLLALPGIWDSQCGFKLFPGAWARRLAAVQRLDGFAFDVELLARARATGLGVQEMGVRWRHVEASRVLPGRHSLQMFRDLVRIALWRITGRLALNGGA